MLRKRDGERKTQERDIKGKEVTAMKKTKIKRGCNSSDFGGG